MQDNNEITRGKKQEQFIKLRAEGLSYDKIALQLKVSKPTLISWSKELHTEIHNMREIQRESLREQFAISKHHRLKILSEQLHKAHKELSGRDYSDVPTAQLITIAMKLENRIAEEEIDSITFIKDVSGVFMMDDMKIESWDG